MLFADSYGIIHAEVLDKNEILGKKEKSMNRRNWLFMSFTADDNWDSW